MNDPVKRKTYNVKRITVCVISDLSTDQRVQKVSLSLHQNGYDVLLVGRRLKDSLPFEAVYPHKRMKLLFTKGPLFYAEINLRFFFLLLFSRTDIILSNDTDTLLPAYLAGKLRRKKLVFDAHELFPEVPEVAGRKRVKRIWEGIENFIFPTLKNAYTVSQSIAGYYYEKYGTTMEVIRNVPYYKNMDHVEGYPVHPGKKILLYQGALNVGRGLEWLIDTMPLLSNCVLLIIGDGDIAGELRERAEKLQLNDTVFFLGRMTPDDLRHYTASADLGFCLLEDQGLSYRFALPNRIFDYMQAGIPILATNFPEIANVVMKYNTGMVIDHYEPEYLADTINGMLAEGKDAYTERLRELSKEFCWEREEKKLLRVFSSL